jgi:hypothetical protein
MARCVIDYYQKRIEHPRTASSSEESVGVLPGPIEDLSSADGSSQRRVDLDKAETGQLLRCWRTEPVVATHGTDSRGRQARGRAAADLAGARPRTRQGVGRLHALRSMGWGISTTRSFSRFSTVGAGCARNALRMACALAVMSLARPSSIVRQEAGRPGSVSTARDARIPAAWTPKPRSPRIRTSAVDAAGGATADPNSGTPGTQSRQARL